MNEENREDSYAIRSPRSEQVAERVRAWHDLRVSNDRLLAMAQRIAAARNSEERQKRVRGAAQEIEASAKKVQAEW